MAKNKRNNKPTVEDAQKYDLILSAPPTPGDLKDLFQSIANRGNAALTIQQMKDEAKRNEFWALFKRGKIVFGKLVPHVMRAHSFAELMHLIEVKSRYIVNVYLPHEHPKWRKHGKK